MTELARPPAAAGYETVQSRDGTSIAYQVIGKGPALVLIGGALNDRNSPIAGLPMASLLADAFRVVSYDRRGRGNSGNTLPYVPEREIEDIGALIGAMGEPAFLFGHSSGAALALQAAAAGLPLRAVAAYEPPYSETEAEDRQSAASHQRLCELLAAGRNGDAVAFFMQGVGLPSEMIEGMKASPFWQVAEATAATLAYEGEVLRMGGSSLVPVDAFARIAVPVLAMAGGNSPGFMQAAGQAIAASTAGEYLELAGHDHNVPAEPVAAELRKFFGRNASH